MKGELTVKKFLKFLFPIFIFFLIRRLIKIGKSSQNFSAEYVGYDKLQGSYSTTAPNIPVENNTYIVFDENGEYTLYRQFEILSQGTYTDDCETNTVTLSDGNSLNYNRDYKILNCIFDDTEYKFEKFSNTVVYINAYNEADSGN